MGRMKQSQITYWCHEVIRSQARKGGFYIDATMGKGNDQEQHIRRSEKIQADTVYPQKH